MEKRRADASLDTGSRRPATPSGKAPTLQLLVLSGAPGRVTRWKTVLIRVMLPSLKRGRLVILLIEDEPHDVVLVKEASKRGGADHAVYAVGDGREAIRYLRGEAEYADRQKFPVPNIILTDLKMPGMDGFEFLTWARDHPEYQIIPVVVYSSSGMESDVRKAYSLGANSYVVKPTQLNALAELLRAIYEYWSRCECPPMLSGRSGAGA